jgi:hypothetical protein
MDMVEEVFARVADHHLVFTRDAETVELHFRLTSAFDARLPTEPLLERARQGTLEGAPALFLAPEDELLHLAVHATMSCFKRLTWLFDLKLYVAMYPLDWETLLLRAFEAGVHGPAFVSLRAAREWMGAEVPSAALDALRPSWWQDHLLRRMLTPEGTVRGALVHRKYASEVVTVLSNSDVLKMMRVVSKAARRTFRKRLSKRLPRVVPEIWRA